MYCITSYASDEVTVKSITQNDSSITVELASDAQSTATVYAVSYSGSVLDNVQSAEAAFSGGKASVTFDGITDYDKIFVWDSEQTPLSEVYTNASEPVNTPAVTTEPTTTTEPIVTAEPTATAEPVSTKTPAEEGYAITFEAEHATINLYYTQDYTTADEVGVTKGYARNSDTGEIDTSGSGQINFAVVAESGYTIKSVTADANYKNIKEQGDGIYRITKITGDVTVTVTTAEESAEPTAVPSGGDGIIHLENTSIDAAGIADVTVDGTTLTINAAGTYTIEGTLDDGQIVVAVPSSSDEVILNLNGVSVTNLTLAPFSATEGKVSLMLSGTNTFTDTNAAVSDGTSRDNGCITSKRDLTIKPQSTATETPSLVVNGNYENGIRSKADIEIGAVNMTVNAVKTGIKGDDNIKFTKKAGVVNITSGGDAIKTDSTVISTDANGGTVYEDGEITVNGGTITLKAGSYTDPATSEVTYGDGIQADHIINIAGGTINVTSEYGDGMQAGIKTETTATSGSSTVTTETVSVPGEINISGGEVKALKTGDDAVVSRGNVTITGGSISGEAGADFFKVYDAFNMTDGVIDVSAANDGIQSGKALTETVNGSTTMDSNYTDGNVNISGGTITIETNGGDTSVTTAGKMSESCKGIKANTDLNISGGTFEIASTDDAIHSNYNVTITGGDLTLATGDDGVHADYKTTLGTENGADDDFSINITTSYEGVEGSVIYLLSGTTYVVSSDDGINAAGDYTENGTLTTSSLTTNAGPGGQGGNSGGGSGGHGPDQGGDDSASYGTLYIKGGRTYCVVEGDGLDSNGSIYMTGGVAIVNGPTSGGNGVFDKGDNSSDVFTVTGGTLIGAGTSDMSVYPTVSNQGYYSSSSSSGGSSGGGMGGFPGGGGQSGSSSVSLTKGTPITISTSSGSIVFVPEVTISGSAFLYVTCPQMNTGGSFTAASNSGSLSSGTEILIKNEQYGAALIN